MEKLLIILILFFAPVYSFAQTDAAPQPIVPSTPPSNTNAPFTEGMKPETKPDTTVRRHKAVKNNRTTTSTPAEGDDVPPSQDTIDGSEINQNSTR